MKNTVSAYGTVVPTSDTQTDYDPQRIRLVTVYIYEESPKESEERAEKKIF